MREDYLAGNCPALFRADTEHMALADARTGADVMAQFIPACPLAAKLGIVATWINGSKSAGV